MSKNGEPFAKASSRPFLVLLAEVIFVCWCMDVSVFDEALPGGVCESLRKPGVAGHQDLTLPPPARCGGKRIPCGPYFCTVFPEIER